VPHVDKHSQHEFVIAVVVVDRRIERQKPAKCPLREFAREFVDVERLVLIRELEVSALQVRRNNVRNQTVLNRDDRAVHAKLKLVHERHVGPRVRQNPVEHRVFEDQVGLDQQDIIVERKRLEREVHGINVVGPGVDVIEHEREGRAWKSGSQERFQLIASVPGDDAEL
jgi:hypothetical protein